MMSFSLEESFMYSSISAIENCQVFGFDFPPGINFLPQKPIVQAQTSKFFGFNNLMILLKNGILDTQGLPGGALVELSNYLGLQHTGSLSSLTAAWDKFFIRQVRTG